MIIVQGFVVMLSSFEELLNYLYLINLLNYLYLNNLLNYFLTF